MTGYFIPDIYEYEKRDWYPHMKPADIRIWERHIERYPEKYSHVSYDVPCGSGPEFDTMVSPETGGHIEQLYKKKIDVVGLAGARIDIIEIKPNAGASAIGQVKQYVDLYMEEYGAPSRPKPVIITDYVSLDVLRFAEKEGVEVVVV